MELSELSKEQLKTLTKEQVAKVVYRDHYDDGGDAEVALLLGGNPLVCQRRAQDAASLYREGRVKYIVPTGGVEWDTPFTAFGRMTEANLMAHYLRSEGVPEEAILVENQSTTTVENMLCSALIIHRAMKLKNVHRMFVVTSPCHIKRALSISRTYLPRTLELAGFCRYFEADSPEGWDKVPFYAERTLRELSLIKDLVDRGEMEDEEL